MPSLGDYLGPTQKQSRPNKAKEYCAVLLKLGSAARYRAAEVHVWVPCRGLKPEIFILYYTFRTLRERSTYSFYINFKLKNINGQRS